MPTERAEKLIEEYAGNTWLIHHHVDGITDEQSLRQLPFAANCLNWVFGHILSRRNSSMAALGLDPLWDDATQARYKTGSPPVTGPDDARPFSLLLADLDRSQDLITAALQTATDAQLDTLHHNDRGEKTVFEHLAGFHWHETYHIGQLDILQAFCRTE